VHFCAGRGADPLRLDLPLLAEWLTAGFDQGLAASSINTMRSSIVGVWEVLHGERKLAKHPVLSALVAAARIRRPTTPRYDSVWDIGLVVRYWLAHPPAADDDLHLVRLRALTLLLAATFQRSSDIARIVDDSWAAVDYVDDDTPRRAASFRVRGPKEHRLRVGALSDPHWLPLLPADHELFAACAARAVFTYRARVAALRCPLSGEATFLSEKRRRTGPTMHFFPLGAKRVSSVAKSFIHDELGVDRAFTGNSFRHAASSGALRAGVTVEDILAKGRWRSYSTFKLWYERAASLARNPAAAAGPADPPLPVFVPLRRDASRPPGRAPGAPARGRGRGHGRPGGV